MRLAADRIHGVRRGAITCTVRRRTRKAPTHRVGRRMAIQRCDDVRRVEYDQIHAPSGEPCVYYDKRVETLRERIEITGVRAGALDDLRPDEALAAGFPEPADALDYFQAELGCGRHALVWVIRFVMAGDEARYLSDQHGRADAGSYATSAARAMTEELAVTDKSAMKVPVEAVDEQTLSLYVAQNRQKDTRREEQRRELYELKAEHARLAALEPLVPDLGLERQMARVRQAVRALEKEAARKRAA